ncbi:MAG: 30S ribosomal protein S6, partial [Myxococcota bacterium]
MLHHEYETIVIVRPDVEESSVSALAEKFEGVLTEQGGHILDRENWGSRKLAYPIAKHLRGHFIRMNYLAGSSSIAELERRMADEA